MNPKTSETALSALGPGANEPVVGSTFKKKVRSIGQLLKSKRTPKIEDLYGKLIKAGLVRVVRTKGKPPQIVWISGKS